ncbi:O-acetyltransferase OatA [Variovorax sp. SRS16]|uniref:acyltransferase family protein n=1 Tax=Variovorax sp. SRS16 TaxID=282217 RepID=UPI001316AD27|nr:acyltransferase family protein [Variovorax sp. SRS16]VTU21484.1 O-acetyltransferase OatA [Variovorax sp. SRS16]
MAPPPHLVHPKYRADIDGLRAIAVLSVVGVHAFPDWLRGGFIGVDIFFVISGFLISTIIIGSLEGEGFSYRAFYARRIKRIFPALVLVLAASLAFGWFVLLADEWEQLGKHVAAGAAFVSNFAFWSEAGYFDNAAETKPLLHLWSLAVEEQFYILWPLLLGLAWLRKWNPPAVILAVAALSFGINVLTIHSHPTAAFYLPASRFWELMVGGMLAYIVLHRPQWLSRGRGLQSILGLLLIASGLVLIRSGSAFPGWWALLPTLGAFFCIAAGPSAWLNRSLLSSRVLVGFGLISYPLYLWHWPLLVYARILEDGTPNRRVRLLAVLASIALAWLSYRFVERAARRSARAAVLRVLVIAMVVIAALGALAATQRLAARHGDPYIGQVMAAVKDWTYPEGLAPAEVDGEKVYRIGHGARTVLLFGDSHLEQYGPRAVELARTAPDALATTYFATWGGCAPMPGVFEDKNVDCDKRRSAMIRLALDSRVDAVVIGACWNCYFVKQTLPSATLADNEGYYFFDGRKRHGFRNGGDGAELAFASLESLLKELAARKTVYLMLDNPIGDEFDPKRLLLGGSRLGRMDVTRSTPTTPWPPAQKQLYLRLRELAQKTGAIVIDPVPALCKDDQCIRTTPDGTPIYKDGDHLRSDYTRRFGTEIDVALKNSR